MPVRTGLDRLADDQAHRVRGRRVGLLAHHASFTRDLVFAADVLRSAGAEVVRLFGPEHGPWGTAQDMIPVGGGTDPWTGLPLVSLYGHDEGSLTPRAEAFEGLDALVIDLQDVGARYYTYAATAALAVVAAEDAGVEAIVCDRPNPLGDRVEGGSVDPSLRSFVGLFDVPNRHGLSFGELVRCYTGGRGLVVPMEGWRPSMWFDETGLPWIPPSPNMPALTTAALYPGLCLIEGTTLSEGRGTTTPFELVGAPFVDPFRLAAALTALDLPGVAFRPHVFEPMFQKHARQACGGVQILVTARDAMRPLLVGLAVVSTIARLWPDDFGWREDVYEFVGDRLAIDLLLGEPGLREQIEAGADPRELAAAFAPREHAFREARQQWRLHG